MKSLLLLFLTLLSGLASEATQRFAWLSDLDQARALALSVGKPMLIVFRCEP